MQNLILTWMKVLTSFWDLLTSFCPRIQGRESGARADRTRHIWIRVPGSGPSVEVSQRQRLALIGNHESEQEETEGLETPVPS